MYNGKCMSISRMLPFLLLNILVSAIVVVGILMFWQQRQVGTPIISSTTNEQTVSIPTSAPFADNSVIAPAPTSAPIVAEENLLPTETPRPQGDFFHEVQAGETLGGISLQYDISIEDIVGANEVLDPNQISVGQVIRIPNGASAVIEAVENENSAVAEQAQANIDLTQVPTIEVQIGESQLEIRSIEGVGNPISESFQLVNIGDNVVELGGWRITGDGDVDYVFDDRRLFGGGAGITIFSGSGENSVFDVYLNSVGSVWVSGEVITLYEPDGTVHTTTVVP